jgi:putative ABC transport system permease protein
MKTLDIIKTANSNLLRNKLRTSLTIIAIFVGSLTIILNTAINTAVNSFIDKQVESFGGEGYIEIAPAALMEQVESLMSGGNSGPTEYNPDSNASAESFISPEKIANIKDIAGIKPDTVKPLDNGSAEYITSPETDKKYKIRLNMLPSASFNFDFLSGHNVDIDAKDYEIILIDGFAPALGYDNNDEIIGKKIILAIKDYVTGAPTDVEATVVGVQAPGVISMGRSWINPALNEKINSIIYANLPPEVAEKVRFVTAEYDTSANVDVIKSALKDLKLAGMTIDDEVGTVKGFFDVIIVVFTIFGAIALVAASIGIINTLFMSVQERTREIGLMKAMGMGSGQIFLSFSVEAILLGFWGSILGIVIAMIVGSAGNAIAHAPGSFLVDFPTFSLVEFTPANLIIITLIIMFIAFLAGTLPARRAAAESPIDALRYE